MKHKPTEISSPPRCRALPKTGIQLFTTIVLLAACATRTETNYSLRPDYSEPSPDLGLVQSAEHRPHQNKGLHFAVAISGGGHRAANFGAGVLLALEGITSDAFEAGNALAEVDILSTVSGGGFAAGAYVSSLRDFLKSSGRSRCEYSLKRVLAGAHPEHTDPDMSRHLERGYRDDLFGAANPLRGTSWRVWFTDLDRGDLLERGIDNHLLGQAWRVNRYPGPDSSLRLRDVFVPEGALDAVAMPHWIANATAFENGAIFPFTPKHILDHKIVAYTHRAREVRFEGRVGSAPHEEFVFDIPLSLGMTASGAFPGAVAATTLESEFDPHNPYLHLIDGGVADNLGVQTALRVLDGEGFPGRKVLLVVDAFPGALGPFSKTSGSPRITKMGWDLMSIMLDTWRGRYRELTRHRCSELGVDVFFVSFEDLSGEGDVQAMLDLESIGLESLRFTRDDLGEVSKGISRLRSPAHPGSGAVRPFELLRAVGTDYNISESQQRLLIAGGRLAVHRIRASLLRVLQ